MVALSAILTTFVSLIKPFYPNVDSRLILFALTLVVSIGYGFVSGFGVDKVIDLFYVMLMSVGIYEMSKTKTSDKNEIIENEINTKEYNQ
ncbi:MAG: hypothetical protein E6R13_02590 [Spirochaetes bacterium]|nr:MAG: hypothetical protein E6R13_02590 [Spirochaetota bacterium]